MTSEPAAGADGGPPAFLGGLKALVDDYERALIESALVEAGGHQRRAAAALGILPSTLCEKMKRLGMRRTKSPAP